MNLFCHSELGILRFDFIGLSDDKSKWGNELTFNVCVFRETFKTFIPVNRMM